MDNTIEKLELELRAALYEDKDKQLMRARNCIANIATLAYNYQLQPRLHAEALQSISDMANTMLRSLP